MSIHTGNDLEDRLKALKKYNEYHQVIHEIDHLHVDSRFCRQSMKIDNYVKITEWINSSIGQSTVIQKLDKKTKIIKIRPNAK